MEQKEKLLLALGAGLIISDIIPTTADYFVFKKDQELKEQLTKGEITPKQYWQKFAVAYYLYNPIYWGALLGASMLMGKDYVQKRNIFIVLLAGGSVLSILHKNIKKDEEFYKNNTVIPKK